MAITRHDPFRDFLRIAGFDHPLFRNQSSDLERGERLSTSTWSPQVDIYEDNESIVLKVDLPEVDAKDVEINCEGNTLTLRGERKLEKSETQENYTRVERSYGTFSRSFTLPTSIDVEHIAAETRDGVLRLTLPKKAETKPRQIKVQSASGTAQVAPGVATKAAKQ